MNKKKVIILGATGSIGESTLKIIRKYPDLFELAGVSFHGNCEKAIEICREFSVKNVFCSHPEKKQEIEGLNNCKSYEELLSSDYDMVIIAIVGSAGVRPTHHAVLQGKKVLLANKESLVMAGSIIMEEALKKNTVLLPVDSEHNSIMRLLKGMEKPGKVTITASGGSLRDLPLSKFPSVSIEDVLKHPTWNMGAKITVDSATMVNKALEIIEAHHLFNLDYSEIGATIHPESYIHAIIQHKDGSYYFHVYKPDMVYAIAYCMFYPEEPSEVALPQEGFPTFHFQDIDPERYPGYYLGLEAGKKGSIFPAVFNAANEEAVYQFLNGNLAYSMISKSVESALNDCKEDNFDTSLDGLFSADNWARKYISNLTYKL